MEEIYKELDREGKIHVEGFTPEQIYYQGEEVFNEIIRRAEMYLEKLNRKREEKKCGEEKKCDECEGVKESEREKECVKECEGDKESDECEGDNENNESEHSSYSSSQPSDDSPLLIENVGTDYSDASSVDEDTYSDDSHFEDLKNKPACELFKKLDKNIRRTK